MGNNNLWNKKVREAETTLDSTQWYKMQALLDKEKRDRFTLFPLNRLVTTLLIIVGASALTGIFLMDRAIENKLSDNGIENTIAMEKSDEKTLLNAEVAEPINNSDSKIYTGQDNELTEPIIVDEMSVQDKSISLPGDAYYDEDKAQDSYEEPAMNIERERIVVDENPALIQMAENTVNVDIEEHGPASQLVSILPVDKPVYLLDWESENDNPGLVVKFQNTEANELNHVRLTALELQYFHSIPAVFGVRLFLKREVPISRDFGIICGVGASWTRGVEGYRNGIVVETPISIITRQTGYSFQSDIHGSLELQHSIGKLSLRLGADISYAVLNSLRTADSENYFDPTRPSDFRIYQNQNEFENINRLGYAIHGGINYRLNQSYHVGLGVHKKLNTYFTDNIGLEVSKNNNAMAYECRIARYF